MDESFNLECLQIHNELRSLHKAPPLKLSIQLAEDSQISSDNIARKIKQVKKKSHYLFGENKSFSNYKQSGEEITLKWYREVDEFKFSQERQNLAAICHFAQIVWKETSEVGFGRSKTDDGQWIVIARYVKPGNIVGKFLNNVQHRIIGWESYPIILKLKSYNNFQAKMINSPTGNVVKVERNVDARTNYDDDMLKDPEKNSINVTPPFDNKRIDFKFESKLTNENFYSDKNMEEDINKIKNINHNFLKSSEDKVLNYFLQNKNEEQLKQLSNEKKFNIRKNNEDLQTGNSDTSSIYSNLILENRIGDFKTFPNKSNKYFNSEQNIIFKQVNGNESQPEGSTLTEQIKNSQIKTNETSLKENFNLILEDENSSVVSYDNFSKNRNLGIILKPEPFAKAQSYQNVNKQESHPVHRLPPDEPDFMDDSKAYKKNQPNKINLKDEEIIQPKKVGSEYTDLDLKDGINDEEEVFNERNIDDFRNNILEIHNQYRRRHNTKPLKSNQEINELAQNWAQYIATANQIGYSNQKYKGHVVGENIVLQLKGSLPSFIDKMVFNWYQEKENFQYGIEPKNVDDIGHFSQVVWDKTKEIGIGISTTSRYSVIVCFYFPPGNIKGEFVKNIKPTITQKQNIE